MQNIMFCEDYTSPVSFPLSKNPEDISYLLRISYDSMRIVLEGYYGDAYSEILHDSFTEEWNITSLVKQARKIIGKRAQIWIDASIIPVEDDDE